MAVTREHLRDYLLHNDERTVYHAYPRQMADNLRTDHRAMLALLADSLLLGDVTLHWEVECPMCRAETTIDSLTEATGTVTCPACGGDYTAHADEEVRVTFSVHPALRKLTVRASDPLYRQNVMRTYPPTTGHEMLTVQVFRDWAQNQPLPPGESLEVRRIALLFTDLSGSTAMYARRGDPLAFQWVRRHFDILFQVVDRAGGAVIKTIGDSVMAAFVAAPDAMRAALDGHEALAEFNRAQNLTGNDRLLLKVGLHCGPTIMVTLNNRLDYFGQTVNLASRVEGVAQAGEVTFSQEVFDEPGVQQLVADYSVETAQVNVKGFAEPIVINRFRVTPE